MACNVLGGKPQPTIVWRSVDSRGGQILKKISILQSNALLASNDLTSISSSSDDGHTTSTLILTKKLTRDDLGAIIECHVEHEAIVNNTLDSHVVLEVSGKLVLLLL